MHKRKHTSQPTARLFNLLEWLLDKIKRISDALNAIIVSSEEYTMNATKDSCSHMVGMILSPVVASWTDVV